MALRGFPGILSARNVNNNINVGIVGPGGRGTGLLKRFLESGSQYGARLTAVCDLWKYRREGAAALVEEKEGRAPRIYRHHEEILADKEVDALIIATPDHAHAQILKLAADAGKDAYCEKPMSNVLSYPRPMRPWMPCGNQASSSRSALRGGPIPGTGRRPA